jgi:hypoxanthine phosphoribosyltransferase
VSRLTAEDQLLLVDDVFDSGRSLEAAISELKTRCRRNFPEQYRIATVYYKSSRNRSALLPDYYVLDTDRWLVFPHELVGLTKEEILEHKPVTANFFDQP